MLKKRLILLLVLIFLPVVIYFSLAAKYNYNVAQDYQYALNSSLHTEIKTQLSHGEFQFNSPTKWDTGFIRVKLKSTLVGYFAEPYVEIISDKHVSILTFERGAEGLRYINLPTIKSNELAQIRLIGHHLKIKDQQASIVLFNNPILQQAPKILVIAPHPDDAEIAAFGLYSHYNSLIVTLTAGEAGAHTYDEVYPEVKKHYQTKGKLRVWNSITVPMLGGVSPEHTINLGYFDGTLEQMFQHKTVAVDSLYSGIKDVNVFRQQNLSSLTPKSSDGKATWRALVSDLKQILLNFQPDIIVTPYPALDWHPDHKLATWAIINAITELKLEHGQLFLYTNHLSFNNYFPYGQQGELAPIPPDFNQSLYFDSIYSFNVPDPKEKIFALDAMNDLRLDTHWLSTAGAFKVFKTALVNNVLLREQSYFRRAVRENELFLVINFSSLYVDGLVKRLE